MTRAQVEAETRRQRANGQGGASVAVQAGAAGAKSIERLDTDTIVPYLLRRGVLVPEDVVFGRLVVEDISRRNRNFRVKTEDGRGFLVKQVQEPADRHARDSLEREARYLRFFHTDEVGLGFKAYVPTFRCYDPRCCILVTDLIHPATSMTKLNLFYGKLEFPIEGAEAAATLLARFHATTQRAFDDGRMGFAIRGMPNGFSPVRQDFLARAGRVGNAFWELVRDAPFVKDAERHMNRWSTFRGIVHGDGRWGNYLVTHGEGADGRTNLRLVDWEMACRGDPAWDVACYLGDYVRFFVELARTKRLETFEEALAKPPYDPTRHHASALAFWTTYCSVRGIADGEAAAFLGRVQDYLVYYTNMMGYEYTEAQAAAGRDMEGLATARLTFALAMRAWEDRDGFLKEWIGIGEA